MGLVGGRVGYWILKRVSPGEPDRNAAPVRSNHSKLETQFGPSVWDYVRDKVVVDFGSGEGKEVVELAQGGAAKAFGVEIRKEMREAARQRAAEAGVSDRVTFVAEPPENVDLVISLDSFEHFATPGAILQAMYEALRPGGLLLISFGPTWYHPLGGHMFSVFPWAHLVFTEAALIRWRSDLRDDGARSFSEVSGGLNQMTVARFEKMVRSSDFLVEELSCIPIRPLRSVANRLTREFTTAVVHARLKRPD